MERKKVLLMVAAAAMALSLAGVTGYYRYMSANYVRTDDARVDAAIVNISPQITAEITELDVAQGDYVSRGAVIARQAHYMLSPGANPDLIVIKSPVNGTVIKKIGQAGEMGMPGQPVAMVADLNSLYITANVEETELYKIKPGQLTEFTVDAFPGVKFSGRIVSIDSATLSVFALLPAQNTGGNFTRVTQRVPVTISIDDYRGCRLRPGMNVVVKIHLAG